MTKAPPIGFDRKIELQWLDFVAQLASGGGRPPEVRTHMFELLADKVRGTSSHSARGKTVTVLCRLWTYIPEAHRPMRDRALTLRARAEPAQQLTIHWAMALAAYPFFLNVMAAVGKILALQNTVTLSQITRRMIESWGDRSTLRRAVQRVLRSVVQWGVLKDGPTRGSYAVARRKHVVPDDLAELLLEALILSNGQDAVPFMQLVRHPALFPFELKITAHGLRRAGQFQVHRQGVDVDVVELATGRQA